MTYVSSLPKAARRVQRDEKLEAGQTVWVRYFDPNGPKHDAQYMSTEIGTVVRVREVKDRINTRNVDVELSPGHVVDYFHTDLYVLDPEFKV